MRTPVGRGRGLGSMVRALPLLVVLGAPPMADAQTSEVPADTLATTPATAVAADTVASAPVTTSSRAAGGAVPPAALWHWQAAVVRPDRLAHASLALGVGVGVGMLGRAPAAGAGVAIGLGLAKELVDERLDRGDLAADVIGAGLAAIVVAALTR